MFFGMRVHLKLAIDRLVNGVSFGIISNGECEFAILNVERSADNCSTEWAGTYPSVYRAWVSPQTKEHPQ